MLHDVVLIHLYHSFITIIYVNAKVSIVHCYYNMDIHPNVIFHSRVAAFQCPSFVLLCEMSTKGIEKCVI